MVSVGWKPRMSKTVTFLDSHSKIAKVADLQAQNASLLFMFLCHTVV